MHNITPLLLPIPLRSESFWKHSYMDIFAFIHASDPTKVKIVKREQNEGDPLLLETTIGRIVPLLLVAPDRAKNELKASVKRLFDEVGSGNQTKQGDSVGGGQDINIQPVVEAADTIVEAVAPVQPRSQRKRKSVVVDAGGVSHPPKKLREDHGAPSGTFVGAFVSSTPEREARDHTDSMAEPNLCTIGASQRFIISSDSSHYSGPTIAEAEVDSLVRSFAPIMTIVTTITSTDDPALVAKEKPIKPSLFSTDSSSAGRADPNTGVFLDLTGSDFLVGGICTVIDPDTDLQKVYEIRSLKSIVEKHDKLLKVRDGEIEDLRAQLLLKETEATEATHLYLEALVVGKERDLTNLNAQLTSVKSQNDNLMDRVHELEISCRDGLSLAGKILSASSEHHIRSEAAISRSIEKGMQRGLAAGIDHGRKGRSLTDVAAYNPNAEANFNSTLQNFQDIMNVLRLEAALADAPGMSDLQPHIEQENIAAQRSALVGVWTPLSEPLFLTSLIGEASTFGVVPAASVSTTALSTTFASASFIPPISTDDFKIVGVNG
ncbi:hypothetical protein Tco_1262812 [Tanacetum coccineum]